MKTIASPSFLLIAYLFFFGFTQPAPAQSTVTIGEPAVLSAADSENGNFLLA